MLRQNLTVYSRLHGAVNVDLVYYTRCQRFMKWEVQTAYKQSRSKSIAVVHCTLLFSGVSNELMSIVQRLSFIQLYFKNDSTKVNKNNNLIKDRFDSRPLCFTNDTGQVVHNKIVPLFTKQYKLVPAIGWEGNRIGLASHWPCVTDSVGSMAWEREMSTPPKLH